MVWYTDRASQTICGVDAQKNNNIRWIDPSSYLQRHNSRRKSADSESSSQDSFKILKTHTPLFCPPWSTRQWWAIVIAAQRVVDTIASCQYCHCHSSLWVGTHCRCYHRGGNASRFTSPLCYSRTNCVPNTSDEEDGYLSCSFNYLLDKTAPIQNRPSFPAVAIELLIEDLLDFQAE